VAEKSAQGATYRDVALDYFDKRGLQRHAGLLALWGLGVAAVVSGDFSGWNFGLDAAGWGGLFIATVLVVIMYYGMLFSIGEMSAALPHTGGAYSFARSAMGPWGGFVTGFAETIEYVATTAVIVFFSASYADGIISQLTGASLPVWLWWIILYAIFLMLNIAGAEVSFKFAIVVAIASLAVLAMFAILAIVSGKFSIDNLFDIAPTDGNSTFLPKGFWAIVAAMPFAMWFFLGIEELPLAAEEAHNPVKDIPRAGILGLGTLVVTATLVLVLNPGVTGSSKIATSGEPLLDGFRAILPNANVAALLAAFALIGLFASLQGIMFAYGRNIYSLSRAGYLLNIAVWGAVIAYMLQMVSYLLLKKNMPSLKRPYKSPVGSAGAWVAGILALVVFIGQLLNPAYRQAIIAIAIVYILGLLYFGLVARKRLVMTVEEEAAIKGSK